MIVEQYYGGGIMRPSKYIYTVTLDNGETKEFDTLPEAKDFYVLRMYTDMRFFSNWPGNQVFYSYFKEKKVKQTYLEHLKHFTRKPVPYIRCTSCGKKIFQGSEIYHISGYIYKCCSAECLLHSVTSYRVSVLQDPFVDDSRIKWIYN